MYLSEQDASTFYKTCLGLASLVFQERCVKREEIIGHSSFSNA